MVKWISDHKQINGALSTADYSKQMIILLF